LYQLQVDAPREGGRYAISAAGVVFGAGQSWNYCDTEAERYEQVQKYLKGAKARASKHLAK
jgi:hypothetical protein